MGERVSEVPGISIVVPIGPHPDYRMYASECIGSIMNQTCSLDELVLVDDMARVKNWMFGLYDDYFNLSAGTVRVIENKWLLGCADSWNIGVAEARNEWCILMGSDDKLLPGCLDACREVISGKHDPLGFYNLTCEISGGEITDLHNNAAMVSKSLWNHTGGFGPSAFAAPDGWLISIMMVHMPDHLHQIKRGTPLYWVRKHPAQDTPRMAGLFNPEVISIRDKETRRWQKPTWTPNQ